MEKNLLKLIGGGGNSLKPSHNHGLHLFLRYLDAFTLAEVLITLGIIGVVAAMTMPALIANTKKSEISAKLKKIQYYYGSVCIVI